MDRKRFFGEPENDDMCMLHKEVEADTHRIGTSRALGLPVDLCGDHIIDIRLASLSKYKQGHLTSMVKTRWTKSYGNTYQAAPSFLQQPERLQVSTALRVRPQAERLPES